jgi:hypothetical protein
MNQRIKNKTVKQGKARAKVEPKPTIDSALAEVQVGATHLAEAVKTEVQARTGEAVDKLKDNLGQVEAKAERLLEKVPGVGPQAAEKLRSMTSDEPAQTSSRS